MNDRNTTTGTLASSNPIKRTWWRQLMTSLIAALACAGFVNGQVTVQVGTGAVSIATVPIYGNFGYSYSQNLYTAAEIAAAGGAAGTINTIRFFYNTAASNPAVNNGWTVYLGNTALTTLTAGPGNCVPTSAMTQCFTGTVTFPAAGNWMNITLSTPFTYTGGNLIVAVDENVASFSNATWLGTTTAATPSTYLYSDTFNPDPTALPGAYSGTSSSTTTRPNIQFSFVPVACTGAIGGTASATVTLGCGSVASSTLSVTGSNPLIESGITYQWYSGPVGGPYSPIALATAATYTATSVTTTTEYYRETTCSAAPGSPANSSIVTITVPPPNPGGTFTIDNTQPTAGTNFNSFTAAINYLNTAYNCGITSPVVVNVAAGQTFNENPPAFTTTGASAINSFTFQKSGVGANPVITPFGTAGTTDFGLCVNGGDFITFDGIDINASAVTAVEFGYLVRNASTTNGANDVTIKNCSVSLNRDNTASMGIVNSMATSPGAGFTPASALGTNNNFLVDNVTVTNCYAQGIRVEGNATFRPSGHIIQNSTVGAPYTGQPLPDIGNAVLSSSPTGIYVTNVDGVKVRNNTVRNVGVTQPTTANAAKGIWLNLCYGTTNEVNNNRVYGIRNYSPTVLNVARGIEVVLPTTGTVTAFVWNNTVNDITSNYSGALTGSRGISGIFCSVGSATATYNVDHNSVNINGSGSLNTSSACFEFGGNTAVYNVRNNAFANYTGAQTTPAVHVALYSASGTTTVANTASQMNFNDLYVANTTQGGVAYAGAALRTTNALYDTYVVIPAITDANSISADPLFSSNMHTLGAALNGAAGSTSTTPAIAALTWVTTDMDAAARNTPPDIGADDFTPPACVAPTASYYIYDACATSQFYAVVNVSSLGSAANVNLSSDAPGNPGGLLAQGVGTYTVGPFPSGTPVNVTIESPGNPSCDLVLSGLNFNCATNGGKNALSMVYNGVTPANSTRVLCGTAAGNLNITGTALTVEAWIYPTAFRANSFEGSIINKEGSPGGYMLRCGASGVLEFAFASGPAAATSPANTLTLNTWQHVAGTFDGTTVRLYKNGVQVASAASTTAVPSSASVQLAIGGSVSFPDRAFIGLIDEVRIWNVAVPALQLQSGMNQLYCGSEPGLQGYYRFDQGQSNGPNAGVTTLPDLTANAQNGTLLNFALTGTTSNWVPGVTTLAPCVNCIAPASPGIANLVLGAVNLTWTTNGSSSYDWELRTSGNPGSGATGLVQSGNSATSPAVVTGLPNQTTMTMYVRSVCTGVGTSYWVTGPTFMTPCATTNTPYTENFNSVTVPALPPCFSLQNLGAVATWATVAAPTGYTGNVARYATTTSAADDWIYTQGLNLTGGLVYQLTYKYGNSSTTLTESMEVKYGSSPTAVNMTTLIASHPTINQNAAQSAVTYLQPATTGTYYIGFHATSAASQSTLYLDDISVGTGQACAQPSATYYILPDCANNQFNVVVTVTGLNFAPSVNVVSDAPGNPGAAFSQGAGTYTVGPFTNASTVTVTVEHNGNATCNQVFSGITFDCATGLKNALSFDGTNDRVDCGTGSALNLPSNALTLEAWIYPTSFRASSFQGSIINKEGPNLGYMLRCGGTGQLSFAMGNGTTIPELLSATNALTLNTWQHVAATYDGANMRMYINGNLVGTLANALGLSNTPNQLMIGDYTVTPGTRNFPGLIDEVRIWSVALPAGQLQGMMNQLYCGSEPGLAAYYRFDQGVPNQSNPTVTTLPDLTANANNGTLVNFTLNGTSSNWVPGVATLTACVQCFAPTNIGIANLLPTSVDLTWTTNGSSSYDWELRSSGLPGSGAVGLVQSGNSPTSPVNVTSLPSSTSMTLYVRGVCTGVGNSFWFTGPTFFTPCPPTSIPYTENFNAVTVPALPACMTVVNVNGNNTWNSVAAPVGYTGNVARYVASTSTGADDWMFTQGVNMTAGTPYRLTFKYGNSSTTLVEKMEVKIGTSPTAGSMTTMVLNFPSITGNTALSSVIDFSVPSTGAFYIGFHAYSAVSQSTLYVDDIAVNLSPSCIDPTGLALSGLQATQVTASWSCPFCTGNFYLEYGAPGFTPGTGAAAGTGTVVGPVSGTSTLISGLVGQTNYQLVIRQDCSGTFSANSAPVSFTTPCSTTSLPYTENFNGVTIPAIPACMSVQNVNGNTTWTTVAAPTGYTGNVARYTFNSSIGADDWIYTQGLNLTAGTNYSLNFKYGNNSASFTEKLEVKYGTSPLATAMTSSPIVDLPTINQNAAQNSQSYFTVPSSGVYYLGFHAYSATNQFYLYVDDITVAVGPVCLQPTVSYSIVPNCANNQYSLAVNVSNLNLAPSVSVSTDYPGNPGGVTNVGVGTYTVGPFTGTGPVTITIAHNGNNTCNVVLPFGGYDCSSPANALAFDGTTAPYDLVSCGDGPSINIAGTALTMEAWIYPTAWRTNIYEGNIINKEGAGFQGYTLRCGATGTLNIAVGLGGDWYQVSTTTNVLALNTWQHVAGTYDGASLRLYVNGVEKPTTASGTLTSGPIATAAVPLYLGSTFAFPDRAYRGSIDEVRIWDITLTQAQILANMNAMQCGTEPGLKAYYRFNQGIANGSNPTETTLFDITPNGNNGTLAGFALSGTTSNWVPGVTMGLCSPPACAQPTGLSASNVQATTATLNWVSSGATSYDYEVRTAGTPGSGGAIASGNVAGTNALITGLTGSTTYQYYVRGVCAGPTTSYWTSSNFVTPSAACGPVGVPYSINPTSGLPACVTVQNVNAGATWVASTAPTGFTGQVLSYTHSNNVVANDWVFSRALNLTSGTTYRMTFKYGNNLTTAVERLRVMLGGSALATDMTTLLWQNLAISSGPGVAQTGVVDFTVPATGVYNLGFHCNSISNTNTTPFGALYLDEINVDVAPPCLSPANVIPSNLQATTTDVTWSCVGCTGDYYIEYGPTGFVPGVDYFPGSGILANGGNPVTGSNAVQLTGLTPGTAYQVCVRMDCGVGFSANSVAADFTTTCLPTTVPYLEGFSGSASVLPSCMRTENLNGATTWTPNAQPSGWSTGNVVKVDALVSTPANDWLYTAPVVLNAGQAYRLSFAYGNATAAKSNRVEVKYGTWANAAAMTNVLANLSSITNTAPATYTIDFVPAATDTFAIGFHSYSVQNQGTIYLDEILLDLSPSCIDPTNVVSTSNTSTSIALAWTCPACTGNFYVEYGAPGFTPGTGAAAGSGSSTVVGPLANTFANVTGLALNTNYAFVVRQNCGGSTWSLNSPAVQYSTSCPASFAAPFYEYFTTQSLPACWSTYRASGPATSVWNFSNNDNLGNPDPDFGVENVLDHTSGYQGAFAWFDGSFGVGSIDVALETPTINISTLTDPQVRFWFYSNNTTTATVNPVRVDAWNGTAWQTIGTQSGNLAAWREVVVNVPASLPAATAKFRIVANAGDVSTNSQYNDLLVDDFKVVSTPQCNAPVPAVTATASTGATVNWTCAGCTGSSYVVEYGLAGFLPGNGGSAGPAGTVVTSPTAPVQLTGLQPNTLYTVFVRQNCNGTAYSLNGGPITFRTAPGCGGTFYDDGGLANSYANNLNSVNTICPTNGGDRVMMQFTAFNTQANVDPLYVYNGTSTAAPLIASANGVAGSFPAGGWSGNGLAFAPTNTGVQGLVLSSNPSGCLTFQHLTDATTVAAGWAASINCVPANMTCATAAPIACAETKLGATVGSTSTLPATACPFNGPASTGGTSWWSYTALSTGDVVVSTCGQANFDTRISVFSPAPDCSNLTCVAMNDDVTGCSSGSSELTFAAVNGQTYYIAVHGSGASSGLFSLSMFCVPSCAPLTTNDACSNAAPLPAAMTGTGTFITGDNSCAQVDGPTACSSTFPVQGVWYSFNSGANTTHVLYLQGNAANPIYTATALSYALYTGTCSGLGASGELSCTSSGSGMTLLSVTPNTDYLLLVYNTGGIGVEGTFGIKLEKPGINDAAVTAVVEPNGLLCDSQIAAKLWLKNMGEAPLTSTTITLDIDGTPMVSFPWTGSLATGDSAFVILPVVTTPPGSHTATLTASLPNGSVDEVPANSSASSTYNASGQTVKVVITTDNVGSGTTWVIYDAIFSPNVVSGGPYASNTTITETVCLSTSFGNQWSFYLLDSFGDGICCTNGNGSWMLQDRFDRVILKDKGEFTTQSPNPAPLTPGYASGHEFLLPLGPSQPATGECDVFNNVLQNKVHTTPVSGVTSYQYEFSNPDAGFRRRILLTRTYVTFTDMQTNPLTLGEVYFLRVRADQGAPGTGDDNWGPGCEMAWSATAAYCTQLINTPGPTYSCGVTRTFNGSDKIWAQPVPGVVATGAPNGAPYQFRFQGTGSNSGFVRNVFRANYVCPLSWTTSPLVNGETYDVSIQVWVGGAWKGFCGNTCQVTINNTPGTGGRLEEVTTTDDVQLWPNPVRDGRVNLRISGITDADQRISVDVYDVFGKRVINQQYANSGDLFNTVLQLNGDLATGLYMVNITVNDRTYTKRLSVL